MKKSSIQMGWVVLCSWVVFCGPAQSSRAEVSSEIPHWDLEMNSTQYARLLEEQATSSVGVLDLDSAGLADLSRELQMGKLNLEFLAHLNRSRPDGQKLELTSPALQPGYPLDAPRESSPGLIRERFDIFVREVPETLREVLLGKTDFPRDLEMTDEDYLNWARKADGIYQSAARWKLQEPYLNQYRSRQAGDIRGYAFLMREESWQSKVKNWSSESEEVRSRLRPWILGICYNTEANQRTCEEKLRQAEEGVTGVEGFVSRYLPKSKSVWESYFRLRGRRSDVTWKSTNPSLMSLPFRDPKNEEVKSFLLDNIEDEWRSGSWGLKLRFQNSGSWFGLPEIVFEPGATPHVNGLGGNTITMDALSPLTEYGTRWTIRHEFGHVLGLPDCYIEFLDNEREVMVSYQIDLDNLMCSRRGKFLPLHYEELKRAYFQN